MRATVSYLCTARHIIVRLCVCVFSHQQVFYAIATSNGLTLSLQRIAFPSTLQLTRLYYTLLYSTIKIYTMKVAGLILLAGVASTGTIQEDSHEKNRIV